MTLFRLLASLCACLAICDAAPQNERENEADEVPHWTELKKLPEAVHLLKVRQALEDYYLAKRSLPANLGDLIVSKSIDAKDLFIIREDGSLECPRYYAGPFRGGRIVLRIAVEGKPYTVFVRVDASTGGTLIQRKPNKSS